MTKFKVGDKVKRVKHLWFGDEYYDGTEFTIKKFSCIYNVLDPNDRPHDPDYLELVIDLDPIEEAKAILEAAGYGITEPKPKLTGQVVVYEMDGRIQSTPKETWDRWEKTGTLGRCVALAIVDWTEGQGL